MLNVIVFNYICIIFGETKTIKLWILTTTAIII